MNTTSTNRRPYVGDGEDGARRSARIDREEADCLSWSDPRKDELHDSAERWEQQARALMVERLGPRPSLDQVAESVGSEEWLAALALLDLSRALRADIAGWTVWTDGGHFTYEGYGDDRIGTFHPDAAVDWAAWSADVEQDGRGWSTTEWALYGLIAGLTAGRPLQLVGTLNGLGSWAEEALRILISWASGGDQSGRPGRLTVVRAEKVWI